MLSLYAFIFGTVLVVAGVLGFVPGITVDGYLFNVFHVNFLHNIAHFATGVVAFICGYQGFNSSRSFFQIFGVIYGLIAILGFFYGSSAILGILSNNIPDSLLYTLIAIISLYLGFWYNADSTPRR